VRGQFQKNSAMTAPVIQTFRKPRAFLWVFDHTKFTPFTAFYIGDDVST